ncbi:hypothetical protein OQA88_4538 [Cercophora sp. LCS_1]
MIVIWEFRGVYLLLGMEGSGEWEEYELASFCDDAEEEFDDDSGVDGDDSGDDSGDGPEGGSEVQLLKKGSE